MTLGSLFDGSGGFPLAGLINSIEPIWASEVEPFPIRVTTKRFPKMRHIGDVSEVNGTDLEPVDIITFGSPCQDMSVAGKRAGLKHDNLGDTETTRSGLFMEAIRIIKEMRENDENNGRTGVDVRPRYAVWENVPGAYSSNQGEDFRVVLEELCKIKDRAISIPKPKDGKWLNAGQIVGEDYSICWRTFDAQYWGVPQRRKRIYLAADFGSECSGKILFEQDCLRGNTQASREKGKETTRNIKNCVGTTDCKAVGIDGYNGELTENKSATLGVNCGMSTGRNGVITFEPGAMSRIGGHYYDDIAGTLKAIGGDNRLSVCYEPIICLQGNSIDRADTARCNGKGWHEDISYTLNTIDRPAVAYILENHPNDSRVKICEDGKCQALTGRMGTGGGNVPIVLDRAFYNQGENAKYDPQIYEDGITPPLIARGPGAVCYGIDQQGGKGMANYHENVCPTMCSDSHGTPHAVCCEVYHLYNEYEKSPILKARDYKDPHIVCCWNGEQVMPTLTANNAGGNQRMPTLTANNAGGNQRMPDKDNFNAIIEMPQYIVRRLTPLECCRLQGFPDWWCDGLETENPTEADLEFWREVFETHRTVITGKGKPKTDKQIIKWLQNPYSDSAVYKMWGNGIALPNAIYVLQSIVNNSNLRLTN